jgi:hypothetical protein
MSRPDRCSNRDVAAVLAGLWLALVLAAPPASAAEPAKITVAVEPVTGGRLGIITVVVDARGAPVADAPVVVKVRTTFGWLPAGQASTDAAGRAQVDLPATLRLEELSVEAGDEGQARTTLRLSQARPVAPRVRPGGDVLSDLSPQPGFISPYPVPLQVMLLVVVLGGIWTTYGYVAWRLSRIRSGR